MQPTKKESGRLRTRRKIRDNSTDASKIPEIRISGMWLRDVGFLPGKAIIIVADEKVLTILVMDE